MPLHLAAQGALASLLGYATEIEQIVNQIHPYKAARHGKKKL